MSTVPGLTADQNYRNATELIGRFPHLSDEELRELHSIYVQLSPVDMALMISNEELAGKLDAFNRAHRHARRTPFRQYAVLVGIFVVGLALIIWTLFVR